MTARLVALVSALSLLVACSRGVGDAFVPGADSGPSEMDGTVDAPSDRGIAADSGQVDGHPEAGGDASADAGSPDGSAFTVPTDMRDRIGIYAWGFDTTSWPGTPDRLNWAASKVSGLGSRTIRV